MQPETPPTLESSPEVIAGQMSTSTMTISPASILASLPPPPTRWISSSSSSAIQALEVIGTEPPQQPSPWPPAPRQAPAMIPDPESRALRVSVPATLLIAGLVVSSIVLTAVFGVWIFGLVGVLVALVALVVFLARTYRKRETALSGSQPRNLGEEHGLSVGVKTFSLQELSEATNQFSKDNYLGRGGFGCVYRGVLAGGGGVVAIKQLQHGSSQGECEFVTEINVISRVHHRNLVSLVGYCISGSERLLVYEYVENNDLAFHLQGAVSTVLLDWPSRMSIAVGAAKGIAYLHEECHPRIIHRDIKSQNILLDSNFRAKIADFGLAKIFPDDKTHIIASQVQGTLGYLAPEYLNRGKLTEKSDVYSFGVVLLELITGQTPIQLLGWMHRSTLLDQVLRGGKFETGLVDPKLKDYNYEEMYRMVICAAICVRSDDPGHRPRMSKVVQVLDGTISPETLNAQTSNPSDVPSSSCPI